MTAIITYFRRVLCLVAVVFSVWGCHRAEPTYVKVEGQMLGTFLTVSARTSRSSAEVYDLMMRIDREAKASMSIFEEGSILSRVNKN